MKVTVVLGAWLLCGAGYALLAAAEAALGAFGRLELRQLARREAWLGRALAHPHELRAAVAAASTLAVTGVAAIGAVLAERLVAAVGAPSWPVVSLESLLAIGALLVLGDELPRDWAARKPQQAFLLAAPVLRLVLAALGPVAGALARGRPLPGPAAPAAVAAPESAAPAARVDGMAAREEAMLAGAFRIRSTPVRELMTELGRLVMADVHATVEELLALVRSNWHSRIPVYEGERGEVRGMLYAKDLLPLALGGDTGLTARALMREAFFVPATKRAEELLRDFQREHLHVAVVVDEYGRAVGLVTLEDVVEEIVGEVRDEFDVEEPALKRLEDGSLIVRGEAGLSEVQRALGVELTSDAAETVESFLLRLKPGGFAYGEEIEVGGAARFRVERTAGRRIWSVRARALGAAR